MLWERPSVMAGAGFVRLVLLEDGALGPTRTDYRPLTRRLHGLSCYKGEIEQLGYRRSPMDPELSRGSVGCRFDTATSGESS